MFITWLGHSSFLLEESTGTKVVTDPYNEQATGFKMPEVEADAITVSHRHSDHNAVENVLGSPKILDSIGAFEINGVHIMSLISSHDNARGAKRGGNLIFKFRIDGVEICHMGDIGEPCGANLLEAIGTVNVLLLPIGGNDFTVDAQGAKEYVDLLMPDIVVPMHYKVRDSELSDLDKLEDFLELFEDDQIVYAEGSSIEFTRTNFDSESTKIVVLKKPE